MLLDAVLRCLMAIKNVGRSIEHFFCFKFRCSLLGEVLDSFDHSSELTQFTHAQFHSISKAYTRNNLNTKAGLLFSSQRS